MTAVVTRYVVAYDVTSDRRRSRLAKCLQGYGRRVQSSVFEMAVSRALFDKLLNELPTHLDATTDVVAVYPLCAACDARAVYLGRGAGDERPGTETVVVY
jgi:CRISPR-associated protein Cas2